MAAVERSTSGDSSTAPARPPPLTQSDAITSLLSLSLAAADAAVVSTTATPDESPALDTDAVGATADAPTTNGLSSSKNATTPAVPTIAVPMTAAAAAATANGKHHRRLGSTGKMRRRLSDAREASARPILAPTPTSSAALSLASLSLSTSPPSGHAHSQSLGTRGTWRLTRIPPIRIRIHIPSRSRTPAVAASRCSRLVRAARRRGADPHRRRALDGRGGGGERGRGGAGGWWLGAACAVDEREWAGEERGVDYRCESCAKIYRHPNCLNKHRWEHTRQWREASKFVLSKHQQVQLLEILTPRLPTGGRHPLVHGHALDLPPGDRSEWPSFLSGGALPKVEPLAPNAPPNASANEHPAASAAVLFLRLVWAGALWHAADGDVSIAAHPVSSSVPNVSSGPRLHDYSLPSAGVPVKVTQVRPGLLGVPTVSTASAERTHARRAPCRRPRGLAREGGWSLPNSALRSGSYAASARSSRSRSGSRSRSRSGSGSRSEESVDIDVDVDVEGMERGLRCAGSSEGGGGAKAAYAAYPGYPAVSTTPGLSHSPGMGISGTGMPRGMGTATVCWPRGVGMKREEDEMSVGFSVREEDEDEGDVDDVAPVKGAQDRKWDGMEMEVDMDMD
ncbi:hypothetical protein BJ912DRAFT_1060800 [Pholiota molesta]|nr:hypothetical protein BJ912DRAFT_1060800 [Pholiota molesta]